ncbi:hypothetical protein BGZ73_000679 [Actinomortierella ambigua]|nr:hypothetical protein BGZ73_000679 [Actinomortierella ambigua]
MDEGAGPGAAQDGGDHCNDDGDNEGNPSESKMEIRAYTVTLKQLLRDDFATDTGIFARITECRDSQQLRVTGFEDQLCTLVHNPWNIRTPVARSTARPPTLEYSDTSATKTVFSNFYSHPPWSRDRPLQLFVMFLMTIPSRSLSHDR